MARREFSLAQGASPHSHFQASPQCQHNQGRGKVFYVGGAVGGGGGVSQFLRINITPNRNRKSCYSLRTFMRSC